MESERAAQEAERIGAIQTAKTLKDSLAIITKLDGELSAAQAALAAA